MTYATTYHIGVNNHCPPAEATAIASTVERVHGLDAKTQRRERNQKGQAQVRAGGHVANGFLRTTFLPKLEGTETIQACKKNEKTERDIYTSLSQLAGHYRIELMQTKTYAYPYNIALALWDTEKQLKNKVRDWDELKLVQDKSKVLFISEERCRIGPTLYYIPVIPLFKMLHDPMRRQTAHLLLSVCSYLYHIADIPYYRQEDSYIYWQYGMLKEWVEQDEDTEATECYNNEIRQADWIGERMQQKLFNRANLAVFEQRLMAFNPTDEFDKECRALACDALALYREYPDTNIFCNSSLAEVNVHEDGDYEQDCLRMDQYISFVADTKGWLFQSLEESTNSEFGEYGNTEEPTIIKRFDGKPVTGKNLVFENRLFALLDDICYLLNNYKTTRR